MSMCVHMYNEAVSRALYCTGSVTHAALDLESHGFPAMSVWGLRVFPVNSFSGYSGFQPQSKKNAFRRIGASKTGHRCEYERSIRVCVCSGKV